MARLSICFLGPLQVTLDGQPVTAFESDKVRALLAYLAVEADRPHRREKLAGLLWPDWPERSARTNLRGALSNLRSAIGDRLPAGSEEGAPSFLLISQQTIQFNVGSDAAVDVLTFDQILGSLPSSDSPESMRRLEEAVALYRGPFLEGFSLPDSTAFEEWMLLEGERLHRLAVEALHTLAEGHARQGQAERALQCAWRQVELDPWHESGHQQAMRLLAASGRRAEALAQYETCRRQLAEVLGVEPSTETKALYERIRDGTRDRQPQAPAAPPVPRHNLLAQLTPFVGRQADLTLIRDRLRDPACRLLTLVGAGGIGKTRLAFEAAATHLADYEHGVFQVRLAGVHSPEAIVPTVAQAIGFSFYEGGEPRQQLLHYLRGKRMLLLIDNYEHLLDGVDVVVDILQAAPGVTVLVTSRTRLGLQGEHLFPVGGLAYPEKQTYEMSEGEYDAVDLFLAAARRACPGFVLAGQEGYVARICRLVGGMPLGILLAAAWLEMLTPAEIAAEMQQSLDFLATDLPGVETRQRSVRAVLDYSWHSLTEQERAVFSGLSVFRGGFTREAAQAVTGSSLRELMGLANKSLLSRTPTGRYDLHELLRQYGAEKLGEAQDEEGAVHHRHCAYYAEFLSQRRTQLQGREQKQALADIGVEIENIRAGWDWAEAQGRIETISQFMEGLSEFYRMRAWYREGEETFARAAKKLAMTPGTTANCESRLILGRMLLLAGWFCGCLGHVEKASQLLQESLKIFRDLDARKEMAYALCYLGDRQEQKTLYQEALAIFREIDDRKGTALALESLGLIAGARGEYREARTFYEESLTLFRELGNQDGIASSLDGLGYITWILGEYEVARQLHLEGLAIHKEIGDPGGVARALNRLGIDAVGLRDYEEAKHLWQESLAIFTDIGILERMAAVLGNLGEALNLLGDSREALRTAKEGLTLAERIGNQYWIARGYMIMGNAASGLQEFRQARRYYLQSLQVASAAGALGVTLLDVLGYAAILAREGDTGRAQELLALVLCHPASWQLAKDRALALVGELEANSSPKEAAAARERGHARNLDATVAELLAELGGEGTAARNAPEA